MNWIGFYTLARKECTRFFRFWIQSILPSAITMTLYFIIFGRLIGPRIGHMEGFDYMAYITPGLIMMSIITNSYANVVSSFYMTRFQRNVEELLVSPMPNLTILVGYMLGGMTRGFVVGGIVLAISLFFTHLHIHHAFIMIATILLSSMLFSLAGFTNALFARKFDDINIVPTFILTPLTYLGGVFYSITLLPDIWQKASMLNPILYMVNAFRYGFLGVTDIDIRYAFAILIVMVSLLFSWNLYLLKKGVGIRT